VDSRCRRTAHVVLGRDAYRAMTARETSSGPEGEVAFSSMEVKGEPSGAQQREGQASVWTITRRRDTATGVQDSIHLDTGLPLTGGLKPDDRSTSEYHSAMSFVQGGVTSERLNFTAAIPYQDSQMLVVPERVCERLQQALSGAERAYGAVSKVEVEGATGYKFDLAANATCGFVEGGVFKHMGLTDMLAKARTGLEGYCEVTVSSRRWLRRHSGLNMSIATSETSLSLLAFVPTRPANVECFGPSSSSFIRRALQTNTSEELRVLLGPSG
jgi:hypothetical protein